MKKLFTLLIALFSFLSMSLGQVYVHDFFAGSVSAGSYSSPPTTLASGLTSTGWSNVTNNTSGELRKTPLVSGSAFTLNLGVNTGNTLSISSVSLKHRINAAGTAQVKVNGSNFGASFTLSSGGVTGTANIASGSGVPISCLSGTVTVEVVITSATGTSVIIDDFTIGGAVTPYSTFTMTGASKTICNADPASSNQAFGLSGSESGSSYELLRDGSPISPAVVLTGTGSALNFGTFRAAGVYTVVKKCNSNIPMTGSFTLQNAANPTGMVWSVADLLPICNGLSKPIAVTVTGGTPPYVISYNANSGSGPVGQNFPPYTSGPINVSPSATTTYSGASVIDVNGCAVDPSSALPANSIVVNVNARPTGALSGGNPTSARVCSGATSTLSIALTGTGPWSGTITDGTTTTPFSGTVSPITVNVSPATTKTYTIATLSDANGCATIAADLTGSATVNVDNTTPSVSGAVNQTANTIATACNSGLLSYPITVTDVCATTYNWSASGATNIAASVPGSTTGTIAAPVLPATSGTFNVEGTFNKGTTTINWSVTDGANTTSGSFTIIVSDDDAPVPTCPVNPGPLALAPDPSQSYATVTSLAFTATDNCAVTTGSVVLSGATSTLTNSLTITLSGASITLSGQRFPIGSTLVTYTVADAAGNTAPCSFTVVVANNQAPLFFPCISAQTGTTDASCTYTPSSPYSVTIQDNAIASVTMSYVLTGATTGSGSVTAGIPSGNQNTFTLPNIPFQKGVTTVTLTATGSSNSICTFTVTVTDDDRPTITCPGNTTVNTSPTTCTYTLSPTTITFSDNCSPVTLSANVNNGSSVTVGTGLASNTISGTLNKGANLITLTATDGAGLTNLTPCTYTITVNDVTNPSFTTLGANCPASQTVQTGVGATSCDKLVTGLLSAATDNCGSPTITRALDPTSSPSTPAPVFSNGNGNDASGNYAVGTTVIRFTATDGSGNTSLCVFSVTVQDNTPPTIANCPTNITVNPDITPNPSASLCDATRTYSITPSDNCTPTTTWSVTSSNPTATGTGSTITNFDFQTGTSTVKFTVTDVASATATCQFTVTVLDNVAPTITCATPSVSVNTTSGLCTGTATVTASATDLCNPSPTISYVLSGVTSGTGGSSVTQAFNRGPTIVTFTATDGTNTSTCQTIVTVTDNQPPTISCPLNVPVNTAPNAAAGTCNASVTISPLSPTDNCTIASTSFTKLFNSVTTNGTGLNPSGTYPVGSTLVTFTTTDLQGLTGTCSFTVNVTDATNPKVTCPANIIESTGINVCTKTVSFAPSSSSPSSDNCAVVSTSWSASGASPSSGNTASGMASFPSGTTPVTFTVRDAQNNSGQCTFNVIVNDNEAPVITAINDVTINSSLGVTTDCAAPLSISAAVTDNCGITLATGVSWTAPGATPASGTGNSTTTVLFPVGTTLVTYTATDNTGNNTSIETFNVFVVDNQAPTFSNCPATPPTANMDNGDCFTERTFSVTASDNCTTSTALVTSWSVTNGAATLGSGSGLAITDFQFPGGNNIVTFTVTDGATVPNTSTCQFTFTVQDNQPPVIAAIADVTLNSNLLPTTDCAAPLSISASATDNCPIITYAWEATGATTIASTVGSSATNVLFNVGVTTVKFTATDGAGNTGTKTFTITVIDNQAPVVTGCPTVPVQLGTNAVCQASYSLTPMVEDNCTPTTAPSQTVVPLVTYSWSITNGAFSATGTSATISSSVLPKGTNTVVFQATDAALVPNTSLASACTFTVVVTDDDAPVVICPSNIPPIQLLTGTCTANYTATPAVSDNCTSQLIYAWSVSNGSTSIATGTSAMITAPLPIGLNSVDFTATDEQGNTSAQCNFVVTVLDAQAPTVACPSPAIVNVDPASCTNIYTNTPTVSDNCATMAKPTTYAWTIKDASATPVTLFSGSTNAISGALPVGVNTVRFTATDASGNTSTACSYTVTVLDNIAPTFTCPANMTVENGTDPGQCTASQSFAITATDNCASNVITYLWSATQGPTTVSSGMTATVSGLFPKGTTNVSFIAQDNASTPNTRSCIFTVTVLDNEAPTFTAPTNKSVSTNFAGCKWQGTLGTPTNGNDNCGSVNYSWSVPSGTMGITPLTGGVGTTVTIDNGVSVTVNWVASDNAMPTANTTLPQPQTVSVQSTLALSGVTVVDNSGIANNDGIVCAGGTVTLTATATGGTPTYSYAWSPTSPAVSNGVAFTPTAASADYAVTVTDANGCTLNTSGNPITIVVKPTPTVTVALVGAGPIVVGGSRIQICENPGNLVLNFTSMGMSASSNTYTVTAATGGLASLLNATGFFSGSVGSVSIPLAATSATNNASITLSFTSADGCAVATTKQFFFNINAGPTAQLAGTGPGGLFAPPQNISRELCDAATPTPVTVNFTGTAPFSLTYSNGTTTSTISTVGAATSLVIPGSATTPGVYTIVAVTDATACSGSTPAGRSIAIVDRRITIGTQPQSVSACEGTAVSFSVAATTVGAQTITYQWYHRPDPSAAWMTVSGNASASSATLTIPAAQVLTTVDGTQYYCGLTNTASGCADVFTTPATMSVGAAITGVSAGADAVTVSGANSYVLQGSLGTGSSGTWSVVTPATFGVSNISSNTATNATVSNLPVGATTLRWTVSNGACSVSDDVVITRGGIILNITAALEGPLDPVTGEMFTLISNIIPADGNGYPSSTIRSLGIVDWITVELRTSPTTAATGIFVKQALIRSDGKIVEPIDGTSPLIFDVPNGNYYISVKHRNHLGFRSAIENLNASTTPYDFDFASGLYPAYGTATPGLKQISGVFCAYTGNINNSDNTVNTLDYNIWQATRFQTGYKPADINLDGRVDSKDYNLWVLNRFKTAQY
jgi:hypothetical protein